MRIRGDQLAPRDGRYDVRITAELWETHFFDHVSLLVVDHPGGHRGRSWTSGSRPRRRRRWPCTRCARLAPVARAARRAAGATSRALVAARDGRYLATFARGAYQGIAEEHCRRVRAAGAVSAGAAARARRRGWIYPTDSSINVAIAQGQRRGRAGSRSRRRTPRARGEVVPDLGFPAGKNKTMLIDLTPARGAHAAAAADQPRDLLGRAGGGRAGRRRRCAPTAGGLERRAAVSAGSRTRRRRAARRRRRRTTRALAGVAQRWRDLEGYHTRFGDVRELLAGVDDRYVIMNAGDEMRLRVPRARRRRPRGWRRDFVLIGDGWEKDGDYNTGFSQTVLPLPSHASRPTARLRQPEDPPSARTGRTIRSYRRHPRGLGAVSHAVRDAGRASSRGLQLAIRRGPAPRLPAIPLGRRAHSGSV